MVVEEDTGAGGGGGVALVSEVVVVVETGAGSLPQPASAVMASKAAAGRSRK